jgi:SAM-dependent methyltransferase
VLPLGAGAAVTETEREVMTTVEVPMGKGKPPYPVTKPRYTGAGDPKWTYPQRELTKALFSAEWPAAWPYTAQDFKRMDEEADTAFYRFPKLVYHIDEGAVAALTRYYDAAVPAGAEVLDICSSWLSHYPRDFPQRMKRLVGTGISATELACNDQLSSFQQADLNVKPVLPFADSSFDVVTCVVSFDYLTKPKEVLREVARVLRPGGRLILSQSNRCFYTKAVSVWTADMSDAAHLRVLGTYIHFEKDMSEPRAFDISPQGPGTNDPMYIVEATRA